MPITHYQAYAITQIDDCLAAAKSMRDAVGVQDLLGAQTAWLAARGGWERSEVFAEEYFPDLSASIDAWPNAEAGFHAIEAKLFGAHQIDVAPLADALVTNLSELRDELGKTTMTAQGLLNGSTKLAYEVGDSKANGGESQFSGTSLDDVRYNIVGIKAVYLNVFDAALDQRNAKAATETRADIVRLQELVKVTDVKKLDQEKLRALSEGLALSLQAAAVDLGLEKPALAD
ncbi:MAG TPA: EfeM/EfeO family lipoprotein [Stellaceae bacterium]